MRIIKRDQNDTYLEI